MPKTPKKTRSVCITLPIEMDDFLNKVVASESSKKAGLTKSSLITSIIELSIAEFQMNHQENQNPKIQKKHRR